MAEDKGQITLTLAEVVFIHRLIGHGVADHPVTTGLYRKIEELLKKMEFPMWDYEVAFQGMKVPITWVFSDNLYELTEECGDVYTKER